jgi:hypothetical protein
MAFRAFYYFWARTLHDGNAGIRGAQIYANDFAHNDLPSS